MTLENNYICQIDSAKEIQNIANNQNMDYSNSVVDLCGNTPRLPCLVDLGPTLESAVQVEALPDSGTSGSIISEDFARKIGVRILQTSTKMRGPTGAVEKFAGQAIIFVKVQKVTVKKLSVLVHTNTQIELLIGYQDLITLRVLAANFPNQVTSKDARRKPPLLTCNLKFPAKDQTVKNRWAFATVEALPDSGCSGITCISKDFAIRCGIKVSPTSIVSSGSKVSGQALISVKIKDQPTEIQRKVVVANITEDMLLSWSDLISLGVLAPDFPTPTPE